MWSDHMRLEERSLALHSEIARRLSARPELLDTAKKNLARWIERDGEIPPWREWGEVLSRSLQEITDILVSRDERATHLRQSSPFCGLLTPRINNYANYVVDNILLEISLCAERLPAGEKVFVPCANLREEQRTIMVHSVIYEGSFLPGKVTMKVDPLPGLLLAVMAPPWRSTIFLQMVSPMPTPSCSPLLLRR